MALRKCKECGNNVSSKAKSCPSCGAPTKKATSAAVGCVAIILALAFGIVCAGLLNVDSSPAASKTTPARPASPANPPAPTPSQTPPDSDAGVRAAGYEFAKKLITPALKSPTSANFPWDTVAFSRMEPLTDKLGVTAQRWVVGGAVDAQNSFGAQIRSRWKVVVLASGDSFFPVEAKLDDQVVFQLDSYRSMSQTAKP